MKFIAIVLVFIFASSHVNSQEYKKMSSTSACKSALQKKHEELKSLSSDFTEYVNSSMYKNPVKSMGSIKYKQKDKIRWEKSNQVILIDGKTVKLSEKGKEVSNATAKMVVKRVQNLMLKMMSGEFLNEKEFSITYYENATNYKLNLVPKSDRLKRYFQYFDLEFNKKTLLLSKMSMVEDETESIVYNFSNTKSNVSLDDNIFKSF